MQRLNPYIYSRKGWPAFTWDPEQVTTLLGMVRNNQGRLLGKMESMGFELKGQAMLETLTQDVVKSSAIEDNHLDPDKVRSSIASKLGMDIGGLPPSDRNVDGIVTMTLDATMYFKKPLTEDRLFGWHSALFPTGRDDKMNKLIVGNYRNGPMQVVSGAYGKRKVHFQAPDASTLKKEMKPLLTWLNSESKMDAVLKAATAHLWFLTLHPFEDGNGRIARALTDTLLARADRTSQRYYSMSAQIEKTKSHYYDVLENTQKGTLDVTAWLCWFFSTLNDSFTSSDKTLSQVIVKHSFWNKHGLMPLNPRQRKVLDKLLDGFDGNLQRNRYARMTKTSKDTALRDIKDLVEKGMLTKADSGGRSTFYVLVKP